MATQRWRVGTFEDGAGWVDVTIDDVALVIVSVIYANSGSKPMSVTLTDSQGRRQGPFVAQPGTPETTQTLAPNIRSRYPIVADTDGSLGFGFLFQFNTG
jgi:hypothetical protein